MSLLLMNCWKKSINIKQKEIDYTESFESAQDIAVVHLGELIILLKSIANEKDQQQPNKMRW